MDDKDRILGPNSLYEGWEESENGRTTSDGENTAGDGPFRYEIRSRISVNLNERRDGILFSLICSCCNYGLYTPAKKIIYLKLSVSTAFSPIDYRY